MKLRKKTLLAMVAILGAMTLVILGVSSSMVIQNFRQLEEDEALRNVERATVTLGRNLENLNRTAMDWAAWDDTFAFVDDLNQEYIDSNLVGSTYSNLDLSFILFLNAKGEVAYRGGMAPNLLMVVPVEDDIIDRVLSSKNLTSFSDQHQGIAGFMVDRGSIILLSAHPITDSDFASLPNGVLIMGQALDDEEVAEISKAIDADIDFAYVEDVGMAEDIRLATDQLMNGSQRLVMPLSDEEIASYSMLLDVNGNPSVVIRVVDQRDIFKQGYEAVSFLSLSLLGVAVVSTVLTITITDRFTLRRVDGLSRKVSDIGIHGDISHRIEVDGNDEVSVLANEINKAMDALESMEHQLRESERRYRSIVDDQTELITRFLPDGTVTYVNNIQAQEFGLSPQDLVGRNYRDLLPHDTREELIRHLATITSHDPVSNLEYRVARKDGSVKWYAWTLRGIFAEDGKVREYQGVGRDLTSKRMAEEALRQANKKLDLMSSVTRHDILNQLTVAHGFIAIAKRQTEDPKIKEQLSKAEGAIHAIQDHLNFTRDYQRAGVSRPMWIGLRPALERALANIKTDGISVHDRLDPYEIFSDPLVEKVLHNLLDNSVRHGERVKNISISSEQRGDDLVLVFEDDGVGIPAEDKERIFEAGFGRNTGYGLFLTREILGTTGMTIREVGVQGEGARFEITIPSDKYRMESAEE